MESIIAKGGLVVSDLKVGDIFIEIVYGKEVQMRVMTEPVIFDNGGNLACKWTAKVVSSKDQSTIDFLVTKGFAHYGPELPKYITGYDTYRTTNKE